MKERGSRRGGEREGEAVLGRRKRECNERTGFEVNKVNKESENDKERGAGTERKRKMREEERG